MKQAPPADKPTRIKAMRLHLCDGLTQAEAAKLVGRALPTLRLWLKNAAEAEEARALGPVKRNPALPTESPRQASADDAAAVSDDPYAGLPPIGEDSPDNPSPALMAVLCMHWPLRAGDHSALDRLAGWPVGTVKSWFERRAQRHFGILCVQLERAHEVFVGRLVLTMLGSGNPKAVREFLTATGALPEGAPSEQGNAAEGVPLSEIKPELERRRRLGERLV